MPDHDLPGGLRVSLPDGYALHTEDPADLLNESAAADPIDAALRAAGAAGVSPVSFSGVGGGSAQLALSLPDDQIAAAMVEIDGRVRWVFSRPAPFDPLAESAAVGGEREVTLEIPLPAPPPVDPEALLNEGLKEIAAEIKARVVRFFADLVGAPLTKKIVQAIEKTPHRLLHVQGPTRAEWVEIGSVADLPAAPASALLLVHGTFVDTAASFDGLHQTAPGRALLAAAIARYDAVLAFDHPTLSADPADNARALLGALVDPARTSALPLDVITVSRGSLIARQMIEREPASRGALQVGRAIFVAPPNGGTALADPERWGEFLDRISTLVSVITKAAGLIPAAATTASALGWIWDGLSAFVRVMSVAALEDSAARAAAAPGLAAMNPAGTFLTALNGPLAAPPDAVSYHTITSDFEPLAPDVAGDLDGDPLARELLFALSDPAVDALFEGIANDLVVNEDSRHVAPQEITAWFGDSLEFGSNREVHHLNFMMQTVALERIRSWLAL